jgi:hypothetical protein
LNRPFQREDRPFWGVFDRRIKKTEARLALRTAGTSAVAGAHQRQARAIAPLRVAEPSTDYLVAFAPAEQHDLPAALFAQQALFVALLATVFATAFAPQQAAQSSPQQSAHDAPQQD